VTAPTATPAIGGTTNAEATTEKQIRLAHEMLAGAGFDLSPAKVSRLIRQYRRNRASVDPEISRIFRYWDDPTGEDATRHVMRQRGF